MEPLVGKDIVNLNDLIGDSTISQKLARWIYRRRVADLSLINDIPKAILAQLSANAVIGLYPAREITVGVDGSIKYLYQNENGLFFESVLMITEKRKTLCISSQSGCRMGCKFCMTGSIGFQGNLSAHDILNQLLSIPENNSVNRIVVMGMGEPFDNYDEIFKSIKILTADWGCAFGKSNITLSTVGILKPLGVFLNNPICNLAVSLHSPFHDERMVLMPAEQSNPIEQVVGLIRKYPLPKPLRVSFEYVALGGINLTPMHAVAIAALLDGIQYHLNIIPWNSHENAKYNTPKDEELQSFIAQLNSLGVLSTIRKSMANDVAAACGQMAGRRKLSC